MTTGVETDRHSPPEKPKTPEVVIYTCPVHSSVRRTNPGICGYPIMGSGAVVLRKCGEVLISKRSQSF